MRKCYLQLKNEHISSSHIMCGYRILGTDYPKLHDFSDDGEWNCARNILQALKEAKVWNIVVFIVHYHNGPNLGHRRFDIVKQLATHTITSYPRPHNYGQKYPDQMLLEALNKAG